MPDQEGTNRNSENGTRSTSKSVEDRPKRGLEDWEMLQQREEPPLNIPYWLIAVVAALFIGAVLLSFPFLGVREGYERPWLDWGLAVGIGYGLVALLIIYLFMRKSARAKSANDEQPSDKS